MKTLKWNSAYSLLLALLLLGNVACEDDAGTNPGEPQQPVEEVEGAVRPIGNPVGVVHSVEVGPAGGVVATPNGELTIDIPAGALSAPVTIGLQQIENTNLAGIGHSYRLTPHGQQFQKPVTISFSYAGQETAIPSTHALGISFQDDQGIWNYVGNPVLDEEARTLSVQSTHFSDWTAMLWMYILPLEATISIGDQLEMKAVRFVPVAENEDDLIVPLVPPAGWVPVGEHVALEDEYIGQWSMAGPGVLESGGNTATYTAPLFVPDINPVAVSLQLSSQEEQIILVTNITIKGNKIEFRIDGGSWIKVNGGAVQLEPNQFAIAGVTDGAQFNLHWNGGVGYHAYTEDLDYNTLFQYWPAGFTLAYTSWYDTEDDYGIISGGGINITSMGETDGWVTGTFTVSPSGMFSTTAEKQVGTATIEGRFKAKKTW